MNIIVIMLKCPFKYFNSTECTFYATMHKSCLKHSTHFIFHLNCTINNKTHLLQPNPIENKVDSIEWFL